MSGADPFDLDGGRGSLGTLVIHGFTGTPYEVRYLGEQIARAGITAVGPCLAGHHTSPEDLARTTWKDWADGVERAFDALQARCERVAVVGQSLGGLLALHLASRRPDVVAVASLAAPLWLSGIARHFVRWTAPGRWLARLPSVPKLGSDVADRQVSRDNPGYRKIPVRALGELVAFMGVVDAALPRIAQPVLVVHGRNDHTAPVACASHIAAKVNGRLEILPRSYHLIAADLERDRVASLVTSFLKETSACAT